MSSSLTSNPKGNYQFLPAIEPYSAGVIAEPGFEIVHVTLAKQLPWFAGLNAARRYLESLGLTQQTLCGVELRCPEPHSLGGFFEFNREYRSLLEEWGMIVDGRNPVARTNVSPVVDPPKETVLFGFSYTVRGPAKERTFVVAGGGELPHRDLAREHIVRVGETSDEAIREKAACVAGIMRHRLNKLGASDDVVSTIDVYTQHALQSSLSKVLLPALPMATRLGVRWFYARPPVEEIEFEMDMRGVNRDITVELQS